MRPTAGAFTQQGAGALTEYSIWGAGTIGSVDSDTLTVVLGTKFRTNVNGVVRGIRWQKSGSSFTVAEVALWQGGTNVSGTRTVSGETASGWQRMDFATPVSITASTIYTASARYTAGQYYATGSYFLNSNYTNGPIEAVITATSDNGVYLYSSSMVNPYSTFNGASYFVDIIFAA